MAHLTPEEQASQSATPAWKALPATAARAAALREVAVAQNLKFDAAGMTAVLQAFIALDAVEPILDVQQAMRAGLV